MQRHGFIKLIGAGAVWPLAALSLAVPPSLLAVADNVIE